MSFVGESECEEGRMSEAFSSMCEDVFDLAEEFEASVMERYGIVVMRGDLLRAMNIEVIIEENERGDVQCPRLFGLKIIL